MKFKKNTDVIADVNERKANTFHF